MLSVDQLGKNQPDSETEGRSGFPFSDRRPGAKGDATTTGREDQKGAGRTEPQARALR